MSEKLHCAPTEVMLELVYVVKRAVCLPHNEIPAKGKNAVVLTHFLVTGLYCYNHK